VVVLFGGVDSNWVHNGETWEWDGSAWTLRAASGPGPRAWHALAYDSARGVTVLFGGSGGGDDTWEWDGTDWALADTTGPSPRWGHALAYDSARGVTVLFGGNALSDSGETWEYGPPCPGDLNGDGRTDLADLGILLADFGCTPPGPCVGDLNGDGRTDLADLGILLADFGCGAP
jgi:hypothetical protein